MKNVSVCCICSLRFALVHLLLNSFGIVSLILRSPVRMGVWFKSSRCIDFVGRCFNCRKHVMKSSHTRFSPLISRLALTVILLPASFGVLAQSKKDVPPPPPPLEKLEEQGESELKLAKPESKNLKMQERKEEGKVTEVRVSSGGSNYTVKENKAAKGTREGEANRAAQWTVMEFGGAKQPKEVESKAGQPKAPASNVNGASKPGTSKPAAEVTSASAAKASLDSAASAASAASAPVKK